MSITFRSDIASYNQGDPFRSLDNQSTTTVGKAVAIVPFPGRSQASKFAWEVLPGCPIQPADNVRSGLTRLANVVTCVCQFKHNAAVGDSVVVGGSSSQGGTNFNATVTVVAVVDEFTFTYAQTAANDIGGGGKVGAAGNNPSGSISLDGSIDSVNWYSLDVFVMVANTAFLRAAVDTPVRYVRVNPSGLTGGTISARIYVE